NRREQAEKSRVAEGFGFNRARDLLRDFEALRAMPEDTVEQIELKAARLHALTAQGASAWQLETACDLYIAAFLLPKKKGGLHAGPDGIPRRGSETVPTSGTLWEWLRGVQPFGPLFGAAIDAARTARAFHWPLEFPAVMQHGGFDVVLGNPPWEVLQLSEEEYFAARKPEIAALAGAARKRAIAALEQDDPAAFTQFEADKRQFEAANEFARESGRFELTARGKVNTYSLFAELFASLSRNRAGVIVPTGIATDATTAPFFAALVEKKRLSRLVDFENRAGLFPAVDSRMKFCLLTLGHAEGAARFAFFLTDPAQLAEPERNFTLSSEQIATINPNTKTTPVFRSRSDAQLTAKIYSSAPVLIDEAKGAAGNPWGVEFRQGLFNMTSDSNLFRTAAQLTTERWQRDGVDWVKGAARYVPLYEAKMIHFYDHRFAGYGTRGDDRGYRVLPETPLADHTNADFELEPFYWVLQEAVDGRLFGRTDAGWLLGWKDITSATNERTLISSVFPRVGAGDTLLIMIPSATFGAKRAGLVGNLASIVTDYATRQKIGGLHLKYNITKQLPILPPELYTEPRIAFILPKVLELSYTSHSLTPFARDLGHGGPPFAWDEDRRAQLRADLDAFYARAYDLDREELRYILDPADVKGSDYPSETFRVLKEKEIRQFGEYRTRRLVLEAWDRMEADGTFVNLGFGADQVAATAPTVQKPPLATLLDGDWIRAAQQPNDAGAALTAILKAVDGPTPSRTIRLATAMMLEPHLLTPLLPEARAKEWRRLVGQESEPRTGNVVGFAARTNQGWGAAVSNHRGNGRLIENLSAGTWAPGPGLTAFDTAGWPDGRAGFVLEALAALDLNATVTSMPDEVRNWIAHASAA
ncbi:MAG: restriction endonuclease, partial [Methylocystaceae bacterium]